MEWYSDFRFNVFRTEKVVFGFQTQENGIFAARSAAKSPKMGVLEVKNRIFGLVRLYLCFVRLFFENLACPTIFPDTFVRLC